MNFASDNWAGAHPRIAEALAKHAPGTSRPYGAGEIDRSIEKTFAEIFERDVAVFFVATGTAANALALTACARPGGIALAHEQAHVIADECGAIEYLSGALRLLPLAGDEGRIDPASLSAALARLSARAVHAGQAAAVTITQATEAGTVYSIGEIEEIAALCRRHGVPLHMDGARFANALVALGATPAQMTWKAGIDLLSFGATKNGCWAAEALIVFDPARFPELPFIRKRAGQLFSKSRFVSAQLEAYFADGLWLANAMHANAMAARLAAALEASSARLPWRPQANALFPIMKEATAARLRDAGAEFYEWPAGSLAPSLAPDERMYRFVTSFVTEPAEIDQVAALLD